MELAAAAAATPSSSSSSATPGPTGTKRKQRSPKLSTPCGYALHWASGPAGGRGAVEVLISARGVPQGATATAAKKRQKRAQQADGGAGGAAVAPPPPRSMLCKASIFEDWLSLVREAGLDCMPAASAASLTYSAAKRLPSSNRVAKNTVLAHPLLRNWLSADSAAFEAFLPG